MNAQGAGQAEHGSGKVPAHPEGPSSRSENTPAPAPHPERSSPPTIAVITGPTAVGKTEIGVLVAEALGTEIVNADSMQVYREMHAGTAKPTAEERARVPHHLVDVASVRDVFTVADFKELAIPILHRLIAVGKIPLVVGGTRLYIKALTSGFFEGPPRDPEFRARMEALAAEHGRPYLHAMLAEIDPDKAAKLSPHDLKRIVRALEVHHVTGQRISELQAQSQEAQPPFRAILIGLVRDREELYRRIDERVDRMVEAGLLEEVRALHEAGLDERLTAIQAHGYKELIGYLRGEYDFAEAVRITKRNTRHYARRQLSWMRSEPGMHLLDASRPPEEVAADATHIIVAEA
ncbi:MAG TPA: tRNA (adenosine(37)-N6)-dimethylallyltransferase MiaA [Armatimonadota bacterium]|nr:tRNA (adenosine(37)-N6)-dimethylallyltransferase MiaA [Armatimonadota bacterium]